MNLSTKHTTFTETITLAMHACMCNCACTSGNLEAGTTTKTVIHVRGDKSGHTNQPTNQLTNSHSNRGRDSGAGSRKRSDISYLPPQK